MMRGLVRTALAVFAVGALGATPALAGNIALTGHDSDFHCSGTAGAACLALKGMVSFARAGSADSTLKVLVFDQGSELTSDLTSLGIAFDNIATNALVATANFDPTVYSAFLVASDSSCGGCDNSPAFEAAIAARSADITNFFNAGGGIVGFSGAGNAANYYKFVPEAASGFGSPPSSPYVQTACGAAIAPGVTPVNGDPTHNFFAEPGTGGVSALFCVAERLGSAIDGTAMTLVLAGGSIVTDVITTSTGGTAVPEPATLTLLAGGLAAAYRRRRRA